MYNLLYIIYLSNGSNYLNIDSSGLSKDERPRKVKILVLEKLPEDNYKVLKYIVQFLSRVRYYSNSYIKLFLIYTTDNFAIKYIICNR